jgi:hypothetical protein
MIWTTFSTHTTVVLLFRTHPGTAVHRQVFVVFVFAAVCAQEIFYISLVSHITWYLVPGIPGTILVPVVWYYNYVRFEVRQPSNPPVAHPQHTHRPNTSGE